MAGTPRPLRGRITRRRFLGTAAVLTGAAAAASAVGCDRSKSVTKLTASTTASPTEMPVGSRGGVIRVFNFDAMVPDSFDPHLTMYGQIANVHSAVFSKLLQYDDERAGTIVPDLADGMPEQPDALTYIVRLRNGVLFHDTPAIRAAHPKTAGRPLEAADVKGSIERQMVSGSTGRRFFRQSHWTNIQRIDAPDARTLTISMKAPVAPFVQFLAGRHAFILPEELISRADRIDDPLALIGTGPFIVDAFETGRWAKLRRNPAWFARDDRVDLGASRPFIDGYDAYYSPQEDLFEENSLERQRSDIAAFQDVAMLDKTRKTNLGDIDLEQTEAGAILASRLLVDRPPFRDDRARRALALAVDRRAISDAVYGPLDDEPSWRLSGAVPPALERWALPNDDLAKRPGYRSDAAGRDEDVRTAKQLWSAALGAYATLDLHVTFEGVPAMLAAKAAPVLQQQLHDALGVNVNPNIDASGYAYTAFALGRNIDGATEGVVPFTFGLDDAGVDLDDALYAQFRSGQPLNSFRLQDPALDALLDKSRTEFDFEARHKIGTDVQNYLLKNVNARIEYCAPILRRLRWGYVRNAAMPMWHGSNYQLADAWLDQSHPAWPARAP